MSGVMIERLKAIECVDDILAVEGVRFPLFGPAHHLTSVGRRRPGEHQRADQEVPVKTVEAAKAFGKRVMLGVGAGPDEVARCIHMGVTMLELLTDMTVPRAGWGSACEAIRQREAVARC